MYTSFYGMSTNPFLKEESSKYPFETEDYKEAISRFNYLKEVNGIGMFCGSSGLGKTYTIRSFIKSLNKDLYKTIYINATTDMSSFDLLKILCDELYLDIGSCYRTDIHKNIQKEIIRIVKQDKMNVIIVIDEAHLLSREILFCLKILYDFDMDSKDYVCLILLGYPELKEEISKKVNENLQQRIIVNYDFKGLSREEVKEYIESRLELSNANKNMFTIDALNAIYSCCKFSPRKVNKLVLNCLMLGSQLNKSSIDSEIVLKARMEAEI